MKRVILGAFMIVGLLMIATGVVGTRGFAQEQDKATAKDAASKERSKAKGYLPPFYRDVIDGVQKDRIYKIQDDYDAKIDALTAEIRTLREKRDAEIAALLSPEQKQRLTELAAEAKTKKAADTKVKATTKESETK